MDILKSHILIITTHNRLKLFKRLISHISSYDNLFDEIYIICDSNIEYYGEIKKIIDTFSIGCSKYKITHLKNMGGAKARNYLIQNNYIFNFDYVSFCDDDDLPFKIKFERALINLEDENDNIIGYTSSYVRNYGNHSKIIKTKKNKIFYSDIRKNNDIGGFSFITLKTKFLKNIRPIPEKLKSNQDWFLYMELLFKNKKKYFLKDDLIGLIYDDSRNSSRLTQNYENLNSTYYFYEVCKEYFQDDNQYILSQFYYKFLKNKKILQIIYFYLNNKQLMSGRHYFSILKNKFYVWIFLQKT